MTQITCGLLGSKHIVYHDARHLTLFLHSETKWADSQYHTQKGPQQILL